MAETTPNAKDAQEIWAARRKKIRELENEIGETKTKIADRIVRSSETKLHELVAAHAKAKEEEAVMSGVAGLKKCHELVAGAYSKVLELVATSDEMRRWHASTAASNTNRDAAMAVFIDGVKTHLRENPLVPLDSF